MIRNAAISTLVALTMTTGQFALAQGHDNRNERAGKASQHDNRGFGRAHEQERSGGRGVGPNNEYYRGDRLPDEYRHRNYVVSDWRSHNLKAPPRGYQWVQSGGDYVLIAIATGIIAELLLNR